MTQTGVVEKLLDRDFAQVRVKIRSACGHNCSDCGSCSSTRELFVRAKNTCQAQAGDTVTLRSSTASVMKAVAAVYVLPILFLLAACSVCTAAALSEAAVALCAVAALAAGLALAVCIDRRMKKKQAFQYEILSREICSDL